MRVLIFSKLLSKTFSFCEELSELLSQCASVSVYSTRHYCQILTKFEFSRQIFKKNAQISNFMKICPVVTEMLHVEGQSDRRTDGPTDVTKLIFVFLNFANAPDYMKNSVLPHRERTPSPLEKRLFP
jgi:hypothetical protein